MLSQSAAAIEAALGWINGKAKLSWHSLKIFAVMLGQVCYSKDVSRIVVLNMVELATM